MSSLLSNFNILPSRYLQYCGRLFLPEKLKFHQRYFCGPEAGRTARQQKTQKKNKEASGLIVDLVAHD